MRQDYYSNQQEAVPYPTGDCVGAGGTLGAHTHLKSSTTKVVFHNILETDKQDKNSLTFASPCSYARYP